MTDNDEFFAEDESFPSYTEPEWRAIDQALKPYLKPDANWDIETFLKLAADEKNCRMESRLHSDIESLLYDLDPNPVLRAGEVERCLKAMQTGTGNLPTGV